MPSAQSQKKLALLVGIDRYAAVTNLAGCVNDVENMKALLTSKFQFSSENITVLRNEKATRAGIIDAFQNDLIAKAQANDIVVLHYSGHGSKMKDRSGDEADGWDETIVPHDSRLGRAFDINDDELNGLLKLLSQKTKNITFIFDSCHSGTAARGSGLARTVPPDDRDPPSPAPFALGTRGVEEGENDWRPADLNYVLISGCRSNEFSYEYRAGGKSHGAFTYFFTQELRGADAAATYRDVMDNVMGKVNAVYPAQHPQLEGVAADNHVFGDSSSIAKAYVLTSPLGTNTVSLDAGQVHGLTEASIFAVYPPGTKRFEPPEEPIAQIELTKVNALSSEAKITSGEQVPQFSRAVERQHEYPDLKLRVYYKGLSSSETLRSVKTELNEYPYIESVSEERGYHLLLRQDQNTIVTEGGDPTPISPPVPIREPNAVGRVVEQVTGWASWFNVLSIVNPAAPFNVKFDINAVRGGETRSPFSSVEQAEIVFEEGDQFEISIQNASNQPLYLTILDLSTDGSIALVFPEAPGAEEILAPGGIWRSRLRTTLPPNRQSVRDILKVFATVDPVDFSSLTQPAVRGGETRSLASNDPLTQLLANATMGTARGVSRVRLDSWVTAQRVIGVRRKKTS
jgi:hypothetical protein